MNLFRARKIRFSSINTCTYFLTFKIYDFSPSIASYKKKIIIIIIHLDNII